MIFYLEREPVDNSIAYDDLTLQYTMDAVIRYLVCYAHGKGVAVNSLLFDEQTSGELPVIWVGHSKAAYKWLFELAVHCVSEYWHRTGIECPMYLGVLRHLKDSDEQLTAGLAESICWWPLAEPHTKTDVYAISRGPRKWSACQTFELLQKTHQIYYQTLSTATPGLHWSRRSQPHWLNRF